MKMNSFVHPIMTTTLVAAGLLLSGCGHTWVPSAGVDGRYQASTEAECRYVARHGGTGFSASGSPGFVAGAAIGSAVSNAIIADEDMTDCMVSHGYLAKDDQVQGTVQTAQIAPGNLDAPTHQETGGAETPVATDIVTLRTQRNNCTAAAQNKAVYSPIARHMPNEYGQFATAQYGDFNIPSASESKLLSVYADDVDSCMRIAMSGDGYISPSAIALLRQENAAERSGMLGLVRRETCWGDFAAHRYYQNTQYADEF